MALPNIKNNLIQYRTTLPDSGLKVKYHAMTSGDVKPFLLLKNDVSFIELVDNVKQVLKNCTNIEDPDNITLVDMQHVFLQIHRASKGDETELVFVCTHVKDDGVKCGSKIPHALDLTDVKVTPQSQDRIKSVKFDLDGMSIELTLKDFMLGDIELLVDDDENPNIDTNSVVDSVLLCIDKVTETNGSETIVHDAFTLQELRDFYDQVPTSVTDKIERDYINKGSVLKHEFEVQCPNCGSKHPVILDKLLDFFM